MVIVMCEASEARQAAVVSLPLPLLLLPLLFPSADLVVQLGLPVYFVRSLPGGQNHERITQRCDAKMTSAPTLTHARNHSVGRSGGDFQKAPLMPGCDCLFTFMFKLSLFLIFSWMTF